MFTPGARQVSSLLTNSGSKICREKQGTASQGPSLIATFSGRALREFMGTKTSGGGWGKEPKAGGQGGEGRFGGHGRLPGALSNENGRLG